MMVKKKKAKPDVKSSKQNTMFECPECGYISFHAIVCPICKMKLIKKVIY